ncbi:MAG: hypothetical protein IT464_08635 [Planctomycetes bacterium]|nr:hypothetical protein [Planctomycetota bacterium]
MISTFRPLTLGALLLAMLAAGCSSTPAKVERQQRESPPYTIIVRQERSARVSSDGFSASFGFEVISPLDLARNSLVQELTQEVVLERKDGSTSTRSLRLVEAFKLERLFIDAQGQNHYRLLFGQGDHHSIKGLSELPADVIGVTVHRRVFAYVANVYGADFTSNGFAHLPRNQDGSVITKAPRKFNEMYQEFHETRGWLEDSADSLGLVYRIEYHLVRTGSGSPQFVMDRAGGLGYVEEPTVIVR